MRIRAFSLIIGGFFLLTTLVEAGPFFGPDLKVSITAPASANAGSDIGPQIKIRVRNSGRAPARGTASAGNNGYMVDVVLSRDRRVPAGFATYSDSYSEDVLLKGGRISNTQDLAPGARQSYPTGGGIPADTPSGRYYVCAQVDPGRKVIESNERNNVSCRRIRIRGRSGQDSRGKPDLIVSNINFSPGRPTVNDEITFWVFVKNVGDKIAGPSMLSFRVGGETDPEEYSIPPLVPGREYRRERKVRLGMAQNYQVTATADSDNAIDESKENNNTRIKRFSVANGGLPGGQQGQSLSMKPDLQVSLRSPANARAGSDIGSAIKISVRNTGAALARGTASAGNNGYMVDVVLSRDRSVPNGFATYSDSFHEDVLLKGGRISNTQDLAPGARQSYPTGGGIPADTPTGRYYVCAQVDSGQKISESRERNNVTCRRIRIRGRSDEGSGGQPDLIVSVLNFSPGRPTVRDEITFWVFVKNIGSARAGRSTLSFRVGGETNPERVSIPSLDPGREYRHERKVRLRVAQNYQVTAMADSENAVDESNESNNERIKRFPVTQ